MTGTINKGDVIIFKQLGDYEVKNGDVMVFRKDGKLIVHRIIKKLTTQKNYKISLQTRTLEHPRP